MPDHPKMGPLVVALMLTLSISAGRGARAPSPSPENEPPRGRRCSDMSTVRFRVSAAGWPATVLSRIARITIPRAAPNRLIVVFE